MTEKIKKKVKEKFRSPSAFTILLVIIAGMAALTWVIPSGKYQTVPDPHDSSKTVRVQGTYHGVDKVTTAPNDKGEPETTDVRQGAWDVLLAPIKGMSSKLDVIVFVLILGGFLGIVMKTGALDAGLGALLGRMKGREIWLIPVLMTLFAIGGTTYGMQEEAVAFYALIVPMMVAAGFNAMTAVMVIVLGAGTGVLASTINPFSTTIAAEAAGVRLGDMLGIQTIILVLGLIASIAFTMRYATRVKAGHYKEDVRYKPAVGELNLAKLPAFTGVRKAILAVFATTFVLMIMALIPWEDFNITIFSSLHDILAHNLGVVSPLLGAEHNVPFGQWYFNEISALFLLATFIIIAMYYKAFRREGSYPVDVFLRGVVDLVPVALIIAVAAGVSVVMENGNIQDTIIHLGEDTLRSMPSGIVGVLTFIFYIPMSFIIPSSSGLAAATMPIIAPIADIVGINKSVLVSAFATSSGLVNMMAPTIASLMGGLALAGVSYRDWLKRSLPIMIVLGLISIVVITIFSLL